MKIHFVGIGGIGVSALARYYLSKKDEVSGSDLTESEITRALEKSGVRINIGRHKSVNIFSIKTLDVQWTSDVQLVLSNGHRMSNWC